MFEDEVKTFLDKALGVTLELTHPPDPKLGDIAIPCFALAKELKKSPAAIAQEFADKLHTTPEFITKVQSAGPYLNIFLNKTIIARKICEELDVENSTYGEHTIGAGKIAVVEYASPNTNKPLHLGHVRNICTGNAIARIYKNAGHPTIEANIVNDRGVHICKAMLAYAMFGNSTTPSATGRKPDHFVGDYYVRFSQEAKERPELIEEAQAMLKKWEAEDTSTRALWSTLRNWCEEGFNETYKALGITFDRIEYESDIWKDGKEIVLEGVKKGALKKDETGAVIAPLKEQSKLPDKVLLRSDGTTLYMTQDLYLATKRHHEIGFDTMTYVVGSEQNLHFAQLFKILELLGNRWAKNMHHYSYGMVYLPEGKMKSREGIVVDADDIILHMSSLAKDEIAKRQNDLQEEELHERAHLVGLSALKFMMLKMDSVKDITFDPNESISFEGDTGPYLQYTHARASSILRKYANRPSARKMFPHFSHLSDIEEQLIMMLSKYPQTTLNAYKNMRPHLIAQYLLELAQTFNNFYHSKPVLKEADEQVMYDRVQLVKHSKRILAHGLHLLGIIAIDEM